MLETNVFFGRRVYEWLDDKSICYVVATSKIVEKKFQAVMGKGSEKNSKLFKGMKNPEHLFDLIYSA